MTRFYSNKERSAAIRAELKKLGFNSKQVSVKSGNCGYSDYSHITIKDLSIDIKAVEKVCKVFNHVDYDEYTGEILSGGNTYIRVEYDYKALSDMMNAKMPEVEKIASALATEQKHIKKGNSEYVLYKDNRGFYMVCYENSSSCGSLKINATSVEQYKWQLARVFATNFAEIA